MPSVMLLSLGACDEQMHTQSILHMVVAGYRAVLIHGVIGPRLIFGVILFVADAILDTDHYLGSMYHLLCIAYSCLTTGGCCLPLKLVLTVMKPLTTFFSKLKRY